QAPWLTAGERRARPADSKCVARVPCVNPMLNRICLKPERLGTGKNSMPIHRKRFRAETAINGGLPMPEIVESDAVPMHREIMSELRAIRAQMAGAPKGAMPTAEAVAGEVAEAQALLDTYRAQI